MSRVVIGYDPAGHTIYRDQGPARAVIASRGGLTLGQALTAAQVKPVGAGTPDAVAPLRGEAMLRKRP